VNYDNSLAVTITVVTCYLWAPSTGDHYLHVVPSPGRHNSIGGNVDNDSASRLILYVCDTNGQQSDLSVNENDLSPAEPDFIPQRSA